MPRILVIDDEPGIVRFVTRALENDGHSVVTASSGLDGMGLAVADPPDLVILDLAMPGVEGEAVLNALIAQNPEQRVLVLSAMADVETRVRCLEHGAIDFLAKPFALRELLARVQCRLSTPSAPIQATLTSGELSLDLRRRELHMGDQVSSLSSREFLLLSHLMRHSGSVCTREDILASVWGYSFDPGTNVVDVYVRRLRMKLPSDVIKTVRNVGYQLQSA